MNEWSGWAARSGNNRIAVVAPKPEAEAICAMLALCGGDLVAASSAELSAGIGSGEFASAVVTAESFRSLELSEIGSAIDQQPPWSDFPFILVLNSAELSDLEQSIDALGHVALVDRPINPALLMNAVQVALRSRARQREAEAYLRQRESVEEHLRQLTMSLETRVRERMADLHKVNRRLLDEVVERQAAENRLRESEELHRYTLELSEQIAWTAAADGSFEWISPRFTELTGCPQGPFSQALHPDDVDRIDRLWADALEKGEPREAEIRMRVLDGSYRTFRTRAAPRRESGAIIRWYGTIEDVHERKKAEAAREAAEERYRLAAQATDDVIWDWDIVENSMQWNASEGAVFGYPGSSEASTLEWWEGNLHPDDREQVSASFHAAVQGDSSRWSESYRFRAADGGWIHVLDRGFIIRDQEGRAVRAVGAMTDLTERRRAEAELQRMQAELIHVSRVSAMGTMASTLAHELNQPLTAVTNYVRGSRRLIDRVDSPSAQQAHGALELAESAALRAGQIVRRLRELVSRGSVEAGPESLSKLVQDANHIAFVDAHLLGIDHHVELDPEAEWVEVDRIQIQQVLINLVRNATQALENQPRREISIGSRALDAGWVEVSVADTGAGIPAAVRTGMFDPFQTTKADGMGIGLSICRTIVEAHGGKIWAEDREGGGTVFRFTLRRLPLLEVPVPVPV